jgi:5-methylcytosine-specific restriction endonuclease McrA
VKLKPKEICPLHRRRDCCGRAEFNRYAQPRHARKGIWIPVRPGLWRSEDGREKCSPRELRRRKDSLIQKNPVCEVCGRHFVDYDEIELGHRESKGIGGSRRNDALTNLCLLHMSSNRAMGSMSVADYIAAGKTC